MLGKLELLGQPAVHLVLLVEQLQQLLLVWFERLQAQLCQQLEQRLEHPLRLAVRLPLLLLVWLARLQAQLCPQLAVLLLLQQFVQLLLLVQQPVRPLRPAERLRP